MNYLSYIVIMVIDVEWKLMERDRKEGEYRFVVEIIEYCFCSIIEWCVVNFVN